MLTFKEYLLEATGAAMNAAGVHTELLTGSHIHEHIRQAILAHQKKNGKKVPDSPYSPSHMTSFKDNKGISPEEKYGEGYQTLGKDKSEEINNASYHSAEKIAHHFLKNLEVNHPELHKKLMSGELTHHVVWTALDSGHEDFTGEKDKAHAGKADVMIGLKDKSGKVVHAHGESIKYAKKSSAMKAATTSPDTKSGEWPSVPIQITSPGHKVI